MDRYRGHAHNLAHDHGNDWSPAWSPDGRTIAFASTRSGSLELWTMASDGSNPRRLSSSPAEYPSWSPDGSRLAFSLVAGGAVQIALVGRGGQGERTLGPITENSELPAWSPDGSLIAFSRGFEGRRTIWTMKPDGSEAHGITEPGSDDVAPPGPPTTVTSSSPARAADDHGRRRIRRSLAGPRRLATSVDAMRHGERESRLREHRHTWVPRQRRPGQSRRATIVGSWPAAAVARLAGAGMLSTGAAYPDPPRLHDRHVRMRAPRGALRWLAASSTAWPPSAGRSPTPRPPRRCS
jgi:hypothetical protein